MSDLPVDYQIKHLPILVADSVNRLTNAKLCLRCVDIQLLYVLLLQLVKLMSPSLWCMSSSYLDAYLAGAAVQAHVYTHMFSLCSVSQDFAL